MLFHLLHILLYHLGSIHSRGYSLTEIWNMTAAQRWLKNHSLLYVSALFVVVVVFFFYKFTDSIGKGTCFWYGKVRSKGKE